ncbi:MAG: glycoside hydrolase family 127 protein [Bacilli bacterium]|nr:glycoside hydrolase family 127 protein [Bacilli bacterium]
MKKFLKFLVPMASLCALASCGGSPNPPVYQHLLYRLAFNDKENLGKNTGNVGHYDDATIEDANMEVTGTLKSSSVLTFGDANHGTNFISLPANVLNNDITTIAMWVRIPNDLSSMSDRPLFSIDYGDEYFYAFPYSTESWRGYALYSKLNGREEQNLTKVPKSEKVHGQVAPFGGTLESTPDAWQLIGFSFSSTSLHVYQNGKKLLSYDGNYSFKNKNVSSFTIGTSTHSTTNDFVGSIADVRVYNTEISEDDYYHDFDANYKDFNTLNLNFNNRSLDDSVRGYNGAIHDEAIENVKFINKDNRDVVYLNGEGENNARSGFFLPQQVLMGHNELTISTNIYIEPRNEDDTHLRVFDFSSNDGMRHMNFKYNLYDTNRCVLRIVPDEDKEQQQPVITNPDYIMPIRRWLNLTMVMTGHGCKVYVDGELITSNEEAQYYPSFLYDNENCGFYVGRTNFYGDRPLHCYIDDFKMYSMALSDSDIQDSLGHVHSDDDKAAVEQAVRSFNINQCLRDGGGRIYPSRHLDDGVKVDFTSKNLDLIDQEGNFLAQGKKCDYTMTFSRGAYSIKKSYTLTTPTLVPSIARKNNDLSKEAYNAASYQLLMESENLDWMLSLDPDRLLYHYRLVSGVDTKGAQPYGSWIRQGCGGEGQFQGQYVSALAHITAIGDALDDAEQMNAARDRLQYLIGELAECQNEYPNHKYGQGEEFGYLNGFAHDVMRGLEEGECSYVGHSGTGHVNEEMGYNVPYEITIWVPYYMYHKQLMMLYDVMTYADMGETEATNAIREKAKTMFLAANKWLAHRVLKLNEKQKEQALGVEWGGCAETLYLAYQADPNHNPDFLKAARFFEEDGLLEGLHSNSNLLPGIHTNTTLPKIISYCAAYEVLGDPFYLTAAENAWDMMVNHMSLANGGISINEHYEKPDHITLNKFGEETCCSYNMLRFTDHLYRITGNVKYAHYFEKVFYNHIMASFDTVGSKEACGDELTADRRTYPGPQLAGKTYTTSTDFGHHKVYSSPDDSFWCCVGTGSQTFSHLTYGNFYVDNEDEIYVNMYNNISLKRTNMNLSFSGFKTDNATVKGSEYVEVTNSGDSEVSLTNIHFIKPYWVAEDPTMSIGGTPVEYTGNDYMTANATLAQNQTLKISLPMSITATEQRGYELDNPPSTDPYSYALHYGPYMLALDMGGVNLNTEFYLHTGNGSFQSGQVDYSGSLTQLIEVATGDFNQYITMSEATSTDLCHYHSGIAFAFTTENQGELTFRPFMDICYERYSMYMHYDQEFTGHLN